MDIMDYMGCIRDLDILILHITQLLGAEIWAKQDLCNVNPGWINPVYGCLIGRVPFMYHIVTIWRVPPN